MQLRDFKTASERREAVEKELGLQFSHILQFSFTEEQVANKNIENLIGAAQIPMGIAGPLRVQRFKGAEVQSNYIPLATTEGALIASVSRGCKAITQAGGAIVDVTEAGMSRGPVFYTGSIANKKKLFQWVTKNESRIASHAEKTSQHLKLKKIFVKSLPNYTFLRFSYDTGDAMGMNMATIATQAAVELIEEETGISCLSVAGNFDTDKKPAWLNSIEGRGMKSWAEVVLKRRIVQDTLKTTPEKFFDVWLAKCMLGSAVSGSIGFNAHIANVIAAIFIATGQDPAHVVEGSLGITTAKVLDNGDLYIGVFLPSLLIGTVGGGTGLPTQGEALEILGAAGAGKVEEFAGIVAAACLAGEVSLLASLSERSLGKAHERLGRGKNPNTKARNPK